MLSNSMRIWCVRGSQDPISAVLARLSEKTVIKSPMVSPEIRRLILDFVNVLRAKSIRIEKVVLFSSYAAGNPRTDSDIDVAIVSPDFGNSRSKERTMLLRLAWRIDPRLEPVAISSKSYNSDTWIPLIYEIREKGVEVEAA